MKINKNETYEQMVARQKEERKELKKRLAEQQRLEKALAAERLLAVLRVFHDGKDDMDIAAMYIAKLKERNEKSKLEKAYAAIEKINKKKK